MSIYSPLYGVPVCKQRKIQSCLLQGLFFGKPFWILELIVLKSLVIFHICRSSTQVTFCFVCGTHGPYPINPEPNPSNSTYAQGLFLVNLLNC